MNNQITTALFDIGGVLVVDAPSPAEVARVLQLDPTPTNVKRVDESLWRYRDEYDLGLSDRDYWNQVTSALGLEGVTDNQLERLLQSDRGRWSHLSPATTSFIEELVNRGLGCGVLSNAPLSFAHAFRSSTWAQTNLQHYVFSSEIGCAKPHQAIYQRACEIAGQRPEQIVFFDDRLGNVEGARQVGLQAFVWQGAEQARLDLEL